MLWVSDNWAWSDTLSSTPPMRAALQDQFEWDPWQEDTASGALIWHLLCAKSAVQAGNDLWPTHMCFPSLAVGCKGVSYGTRCRQLCVYCSEYMDCSTYSHGVRCASTPSLLKGFSSQQSWWYGPYILRYMLYIFTTCCTYSYIQYST